MIRVVGHGSYVRGGCGNFYGKEREKEGEQQQKRKQMVWLVDTQVFNSFSMLLFIHCVFIVGMADIGSGVCVN